jgi:hypothetical protein
MKKIILLVAVVSTLLSAVFASAQGLKDAGDILDRVDGRVNGQGGGELGVTADLSSAISTVIKAILSLVGTIFLSLTIYAGILWMTAAGEEEKVTKATGILKMAVIGLVIVMSAYAITYFVTTNLTALK